MPGITLKAILPPGRGSNFYHWQSHSPVMTMYSEEAVLDGQHFLSIYYVPAMGRALYMDFSIKLCDKLIRKAPL